MTATMNLTTGSGKVHATALVGQTDAHRTACAPSGHNGVRGMRWTDAPVDCKKCLASKGPQAPAPVAPVAPVEEIPAELDMVWQDVPVKVLDGPNAAGLVEIENAKGWTRTVPASEVAPRLAAGADAQRIRIKPRKVGAGRVGSILETRTNRNGKVLVRVLWDIVSPWDTPVGWAKRWVEFRTEKFELIP